MTSEIVALPAKMAWYIEPGVIRHVWYPVFPPDKNAEVVLSWCERRRESAARGG